LRCGARRSAAVSRYRQLRSAAARSGLVRQTSAETASRKYLADIEARLPFQFRPFRFRPFRFREGG